MFPATNGGFSTYEIFRAIYQVAETIRPQRKRRRKWWRRRGGDIWIANVKLMKNER